MIGAIDKTLSLRTEMKVLFKNADILGCADGSVLITGKRIDAKFQPVDD